MKTAVPMLLVLFLLFSQKGGILMGIEEKHIIRKMPMAHCKKGPQRCEACRSMDSSKFCLLRLCAPDGMQRRVTEVTENGRKVFREFEVERVFDSEEDARVYALENGIEDAPWENLPPAPGSVEDDGVLKAFRRALPAGWTMTMKHSLLLVRRVEPVRVIYGNRINAPASLKAPDEDYFKSQGKQEPCFILLPCEKKWDAERVKRASRGNESTRKAIEALPVKYGITGLLNEHLSSKGMPVFIGTTAAEKDKIRAYEEEKAHMNSRYVKLPDYSTEKFSLFLLKKRGIEDDFHQVWPPDASTEAARVLELLRGDTR